MPSRPAAICPETTANKSEQIKRDRAGKIAVLRIREVDLDASRACGARTRTRVANRGRSSRRVVRARTVGRDRLRTDVRVRTSRRAIPRAVRFGRSPRATSGTAPHGVVTSTGRTRVVRCAVGHHAFCIRTARTLRIGQRQPSTSASRFRSSVAVIKCRKCRRVIERPPRGSYHPDRSREGGRHADRRR
jgi:hypothetical protein